MNDLTNRATPAAIIKALGAGATWESFSGGFGGVVYGGVCIGGWAWPDGAPLREGGDYKVGRDDEDYDDHLDYLAGNPAAAAYEATLLPCDPICLWLEDDDGSISTLELEAWTLEEVIAAAHHTNQQQQGVNDPRSGDASGVR